MHVAVGGAAGAQATLVEMEPHLAAMAAPRCWAAQTQTLRLAWGRRRRAAPPPPRLMQLQALFDDLRAAAPAGDTFLGRHLGVTEGDGGEQLAAAGINGDGAGAAAPARRKRRRRRRRRGARRRGGAGCGRRRWRRGGRWARSWRGRSALSLFTEAVRLFEELELWDEMVSCLIVLQRGWEAEDIVRRRLDDAKTATPAMHCYLGDLQKEESHYVKAWEKSNGSCARAKLSLGAAAMAREAWAEARAHLKDALRVKAHYHQAWYSSALCALKLGDDDGALVDLRKVIAIDPTQLHAWAHLGALFQKKKLKREALYAFREVTRLRGDDWRHWQNRALSAVSLAHFEEALFCARRSMEAGGPADAEVTSLVAQALHKRLPAAHGATGDRLFPSSARSACLLHEGAAAAQALGRPRLRRARVRRGEPPRAARRARRPGGGAQGAHRVEDRRRHARGARRGDGAARGRGDRRGRRRPGARDAQARALPPPRRDGLPRRDAGDRGAPHARREVHAAPRRLSGRERAKF